MEWIFYIFIGLVVISAFFGKSSDEDCDKYDAIFGNNDYSDDCDDMFDPDYCPNYWTIGPGGSQQDDLFYEDPWKNDTSYDDTWSNSDDLWKDDDK